LGTAFEQRKDSAPASQGFFAAAASMFSKPMDMARGAYESWSVGMPEGDPKTTQNDVVTGSTSPTSHKGPNDDKLAEEARKNKGTSAGSQSGAGKIGGGEGGQSPGGKMGGESAGSTGGHTGTGSTGVGSTGAGSTGSHTGAGSTGGTSSQNLTGQSTGAQVGGQSAGGQIGGQTTGSGSTGNHTRGAGALGGKTGAEALGGQAGAGALGGPSTSGQKTTSGPTGGPLGGQSNPESFGNQSTVTGTTGGHTTGAGGQTPPGSKLAGGKPTSGPDVGGNQSNKDFVEKVKKDTAQNDVGTGTNNSKDAAAEKMKQERANGQDKFTNPGPIGGVANDTRQGAGGR